MKKIIASLTLALTLTLSASKTPQFELRNRLNESKNYKNVSITLIVVPAEIGWQGLAPAASLQEAQEQGVKIGKMEDPIIITAGDYEQHEAPIKDFMLIIGQEAWFINLNPKRDQTCYLEIRENKDPKSERHFTLSPQTSRFRSCPITQGGLYLGNNISGTGIELKAKGQPVLDRILLYQKTKAEQLLKKKQN